MSHLRNLTVAEIAMVSGAGPIATGAEAAGSALGAAAGTQSGGAFGAELGGAICSPAGPEAAAVCAIIGYGIGKRYGTVVGATGGAIVGKAIGEAVEDFLNNFQNYLGQLDTVRGVVDNWFGSWGLDATGGSDYDAGLGSGGGDAFGVDLSAYTTDYNFDGGLSGLSVEGAMYQ